MAIEKGTMRHVFMQIYKKFIEDEELLRLLYYPPQDGTNPDPLSPTLLNVKGLPNYWDIVDERFSLTNKTSDLVDKPICRININAGRRTGVFGNYLLAQQEIYIAISVHEDYEKDMRTAWIADRIHELLALEYFESAYGKMDFVNARSYEAEKQYTRYVITYEFNTNKK